MSVYVGDEGTEISLDCVVNVSTATVRKIKVTTPTGEDREWIAVADGATAIKYVLAAGDINQAGQWRLQAYIEMPGWKGRGKPCSMTVLE